MNDETRSGREHEGSRTRQRPPARKWLVALALVLTGVLIGSAGYRGWSAYQHHQRLKADRQRAESLHRQLTPRVEAQLSLLAKQLDDLEDDLMEANTATASSAIPMRRYLAQLKRVRTHAEQADQMLQELGAVSESPFSEGRSAGARPPVTADQRRRLSGFQEEAEGIHHKLAAVSGQLDLARERRLQLILVESEAARREQAEEMARRAQAEAEAARRAEAAAQAKADAARTAQIQTLERAQAEASHRAQMESMQRTLVEAMAAPRATVVPQEPLVIQRVVQPAVRYAEPQLVIGRSYPDRFLGYRDSYGYPFFPIYRSPFRLHSWCW